MTVDERRSGPVTRGRVSRRRTGGTAVVTAGGLVRGALRFVVLVTTLIGSLVVVYEVGLTVPVMVINASHEPVAAGRFIFRDRARPLRPLRVGERQLFWIHASGERGYWVEVQMRSGKVSRSFEPYLAGEPFQAGELVVKDGEVDLRETSWFDAVASRR